jgi:GNAT superfamily N-acetyltransferase
MLIREAKASDIPRVIDGIKHFVSVSSYGQDDAVNADHVTATLDHLIWNEDGLVAVMETDAKEFAGCFVGMAHAHLFSGERMLGELFIYTTPEARGNGSKLRRYAEEWARGRGCRTFTIAHPESEAHLSKVYARWGFKPCETHYRKELA